ncbi:MAG: hypothetical protein KDH15_08935 [Rhodocyclaceae bacterium]|nr:hypothetical protein [Rhodocyclaceae bacterium]
MQQPAMKQFAVAALAAAGLSLSSSGIAAGSCKGLEKEKCTPSAGCTWIDSYSTKKGITVEAYCRSKGGNSSASASATKHASNSGSSKQGASH